MGSCYSKRRGLCSTHCRKPCSVDGCSTKVAARGLCKKHSALGECLREGCTTPTVKKGGLCGKHRLSCAEPDCDNRQISIRGKCHTHDSKAVACSVEGCIKRPPPLTTASCECFHWRQRSRTLLCSRSTSTMDRRWKLSRRPRHAQCGQRW